ncbi:hypothetical protein GJ496_008822, partial [Pomphorhynchus laevis]
MQVNQDLDPNKHAYFEDKWRKVLENSQKQLLRILRDYYVYLNNTVCREIDETTYDRALNIKLSKIRRTFGHDVHKVELSRIEVHPNRRFVHRQRITQTFSIPEKNIIKNISDRPLSSDEKSLLNYGLNFVPTQREFNRQDLTKSIRSAGNKIFKTEREENMR